MRSGRSGVPIHDLGYRGWEGRRSSDTVRWWVIAQTGVRLAWKSSWVRRMLFFAWLPTLAWGVAFFLYEQVLLQPAEFQQGFVEFLQVLDFGGGDFDELIAAVREDPRAARHQVWATLLMIYFRSPQAILMVMLVGLIAPPLISQDIRSRAFLVYFSRPLTPVEYVLGKASVVWAYLLMITGIPAIALYALAILLSPDLSLLAETWDLPLRIAGASVVLLVPTTAVALCFSSMTSESRYAGFAWFAVWILGMVTYVILSARDTAVSFDPERGFQEMPDRWTLVSPYATLGEVQRWVFGLKADFGDVQPEAFAILTVTVIATVVLLRRVSAPMRV
jgi:ABC-2 type transport system permease protein